MTKDSLNIQSRQVEWYRENGRHPQRIVKDSNNNDYVIGDWSWNKKVKSKTKCPHCGKLMSAAFEVIEEGMKRALC